MSDRPEDEQISPSATAGVGAVASAELPARCDESARVESTMRVFVAWAEVAYEGGSVQAVCASRAQAVRAMAETCARGGRLDCFHDQHSVMEWDVEADGASFTAPDTVYRRTFADGGEVYPEALLDAARDPGPAQPAGIGGGRDGDATPTRLLKADASWSVPRLLRALEEAARYHAEAVDEADHERSQRRAAEARESALRERVEAMARDEELRAAAFAVVARDSTIPQAREASDPLMHVHAAVAHALRSLLTTKGD